MYTNGRNYRLTKHGRKRYLQRVAPLLKYVPTDVEIMEHCLCGLNDVPFRPIWKPDKNERGAYRLVTVVPKFLGIPGKGIVHDG